METIDQTLKDLVIKEAKALKQHATKEELARLDFENFDGGIIDRCVYGQMTGSCFSTRAHELIDTCCERVYFEANYWSPIEVFVSDRSKKQVKPLINFLKGETETLEL